MLRLWCFVMFTHGALNVQRSWSVANRSDKLKMSEQGKCRVTMHVSQWMMQQDVHISSERAGHANSFIHSFSRPAVSLLHSSAPFQLPLGKGLLDSFIGLVKSLIAPLLYECEQPYGKADQTAPNKDLKRNKTQAMVMLLSWLVKNVLLMSMPLILQLHYWQPDRVCVANFIF